jgi:hypothetical protein
MPGPDVNELQRVMEEAARAGSVGELPPEARFNPEAAMGGGAMGNQPSADPGIMMQQLMKNYGPTGNTGSAVPSGLNGVMLNLIGAVMQSLQGKGLGSNAMAGVGNMEGGGGQPAAAAVRAVAPPGADGVPETPGLVERPGAGGDFGRMPRAGGEYRTRTIRPGETLSGIAGGSGPKRIGLAMGANPSISDPNKIRAGGMINVPITGVTRAKSKRNAKAATPVATGKKQAKPSVKSYAQKAARDQSAYGDRVKKRPTASQTAQRRNLASGGRY